MDYAELYEFLRKEKYSEQLQLLPKDFVESVSAFLDERKSQMARGDDFSDDSFKVKKQFENALSLFRELVRIRKRKLLNLAFAASETGIMKRDFGVLLSFEQELFEKIVNAVAEGDRVLHDKLNNTKAVMKAFDGIASKYHAKVAVVAEKPFDKAQDKKEEVVAQ